MNKEQLHELLYQGLQTEIGGQQIYKTAIRCAQDDGLREEWQGYLEETKTHEQHLLEVFDSLGLDPSTETDGRAIVRQKGEDLVKAMEQALESGDGILAQLVAAESVVEAETKDHQNWELIGLMLDHVEESTAEVLRKAYEEVAEEEDEHLYHTMGWCRELWLQSLGVPAAVPPPEEVKEVKTAIGAARAKNKREEMVNS